MDLSFDRTPPAERGVIMEVAPGIRRIVLGQPGPFTFTGTCCYLVGKGEVTLIDPGPDDDEMMARIIANLPGERITRILVTHTHRDHSPAARHLQALTGAPILGCAPHRNARPPLGSETLRLDASADMEYAPDTEVREGDRIEAGDHCFSVMATPGHTMNHLVFTLDGTGMVFSGDHVMAWSTSVVAPPDGAMAPYMASLERFSQREDDRVFWPGHGGPVTEPRRFTRALLHHRRQREAQIMDRLASGPATIPELVAANYPSLAPNLHGAAGLSVFAHLEDLVARALVGAEPHATINARYFRQ